MTVPSQGSSRGLDSVLYAASPDQVEISKAIPLENVSSSGTLTVGTGDRWMATTAVASDWMAASSRSVLSAMFLRRILSDLTDMMFF